jgi:peptidyl-prolyl cis-trans isomerase B (cyclophilin B)
LKKKLIFLILTLPVLILVLVGCGPDESAAVAEEESAVEAPDLEEAEPEVNEALPLIIELEGIDINNFPVSEERPSVEIYIEDHGIIVVELFPEYAPITVENFLNLVDDGFYDGLTFHRIISGFMMQGGCPYGEGFGGSEENIVGEFLANGINNPILHTRGILSMARGTVDFNSASSQFFIMHQDAPFLNDDYAAFGRVIQGMDVVDSIVLSVIPLDNDGTIDPDEQPVIREVRVVN